MKKLCAFLFLLGVSAGHVRVFAEVPLRDDQVLIYEMKEDPSLPQFVANYSAKGFFALEIDEFKGLGSVTYRVDNLVVTADADLTVKKNQLILTYGKRKKIWIRSQQTDASGKTHDVILPSGCDGDQVGWRYGGSFARHVVRRSDDTQKRIIASNASLEFELAQERCGGPNGECGPVGCGLSNAVSSGTVAPLAAATPVPVSTLTFHAALLEAKLSSSDMLRSYQADIDTVLPAPLLQLSVVSTDYVTTPYPFLGNTDPFIEKRQLKVGVISKRYLLEDKITSMTVSIEPLLEEFRDGSSKCGAWDSNLNRSMFDFRGRSAMYEHVPSSPTDLESSAFYVCGQTVSISMKVQGSRARELFTQFADQLPFDLIEKIIGGSK